MLFFLLLFSFFHLPPTPRGAKWDKQGRRCIMEITHCYIGKLRGLQVNCKFINPTSSQFHWNISIKRLLFKIYFDKTYIKFYFYPKPKALPWTLQLGVNTLSRRIIILLKTQASFRCSLLGTRTYTDHDDITASLRVASWLLPAGTRDKQFRSGDWQSGRVVYQHRPLELGEESTSSKQRKACFKVRKWLGVLEDAKQKILCYHGVSSALVLPNVAHVTFTPPVTDFDTSPPPPPPPSSCDDD